MRDIEAFEPRGWSIIHVFEGANKGCEYVTVVYNALHEAGKRDGTNHADGISLACRNSYVAYNHVSDATDGGIVIFGSPGSTIEWNYVENYTRPGYGGINMVDYAPYDGDYTGTQVLDNTIDAGGFYPRWGRYLVAGLQVGIAMGPRTWFCPSPTGYNHGGRVERNKLYGDGIRYGIVADGVSLWTAVGNQDFTAGNWGAMTGCEGNNSAPVSKFQRHWTHAFGTFQPEFIEGTMHNVVD